LSGNVISTLAGATLGQRLVVGLESADSCGRLHVTLTEQNHADGIGWFDQRTLRLDSRQWSQLRTLFSAIDREVAMAEPHEPPATIPFPALFDDRSDEEGLSQQVG